MLTHTVIYYQKISKTFTLIFKWSKQILFSQTFIEAYSNLKESLSSNLHDSLTFLAHTYFGRVFLKKLFFVKMKSSTMPVTPTRNFKRLLRLFSEVYHPCSTQNRFDLYFPCSATQLFQLPRPLQH